VKKYTRLKLAFLLILILVSIFLSGCSTTKNSVAKAEEFTTNKDSIKTEELTNKNVATESEAFAMGTVITQKVYGENRQVAIDQAIERIKYLENLLTFNDPQGDINSLNENAGKKNVELNPLTLEVIKKAQQVSEQSNGAFDITIGPLVKCWGIGTEHARIPFEQELHKLFPLINYKNLEVDDHSAFLKHQGQMVDLGGIAKGYAGDQVIDLYKKNGVQSAFVNLGGNVVTLGSKPDGSPWSVGIRNPRKEGDGNQILGTISVSNKAVVTAGDGERYFIQEGKRYHHILDPHTGYPAKSDLMSVTLVTDSSLNADALDTAVFILGLEKGLDLIKKQGGIEAVFITTDKKIIVTEGLRSNFTLIDGSGYQLVQ
jgi:FAD:protein FMN transferase